MSGKRIILYSNAERDINYKMAIHVAELLLENGRQPVFCPMFFDQSLELISHKYDYGKIEAELKNAEMIITFGGDGTILRAARAAAQTGVPILGINMGGKGFMAELETEDIGLLEKVICGEYRIENRMMLDAEISRSGKAIYRDFALNDVVVRGDNKVIDLVLLGDGEEISRFSGDGAVIATPTGSTAYSMAAGGPIVEEAADNIIVTPICAHELMAKSFVLVSERRVSVQMGSKKHNPAHISVDGSDYYRVLPGDIIYINKSEKYTRLVRLSNRSFYKKVSEKLGERA